MKTLEEHTLSILEDLLRSEPAGPTLALRTVGALNVYAKIEQVQELISELKAKGELSAAERENALAVCLVCEARGRAMPSPLSVRRNWGIMCDRLCEIIL